MKQNQDITIRKATEADFPRLIHLFLEFATFGNLQHRIDNSVERNCMLDLSTSVPIKL
jgi:hypothetical protein